GAAWLGCARPDRDAGADRGPVRLGVGVAGDRSAAARAARPGGAHPRAAVALVRRGGRLRRRGRRGHQAREDPIVTVTTPAPEGLGPAAAGGQASSVDPPGASRANPLPEFYETP